MMKRFLVPALFTALTLTILASLPFQTEAVASKMQPGYMAHKSGGLNANTACRRPKFNVCQGCNVNLNMRVAVDRQCGFNFQSLGPFAGQEIVVSPRNGSYSLINETKAVYRPNSGYTGSDYFEARLFFEEGSGKRTFLIMKVNVSVLPHL